MRDLRMRAAASANCEATSMRISGNLNRQNAIDRFET